MRPEAYVNPSGTPVFKPKSKKETPYAAAKALSTTDKDSFPGKSLLKIVGVIFSKLVFNSLRANNNKFGSVCRSDYFG